MKARVIGAICGLLAVALLFLPEGGSEPKPVPPKPPVDIVAESFDIYEDLWRKNAQNTADRIASGELTTDKEVWEYIATGQEPARRVAFDEIAKKEQEYFEGEGGWTPELHEKLLRSYVK